MLRDQKGPTYRSYRNHSRHGNPYGRHDCIFTNIQFRSVK